MNTRRLSWPPAFGGPTGELGLRLSNLGPRVSLAQPDPEREADCPIAYNDAAVVIDHEDRPICLRPISEDVGHLVVAIEDRFDDAQFGAVLVQPRLVAAEDQRYRSG